jgi:coenzyme F420 hydrogenase subunit beta
MDWVLRYAERFGGTPSAEEMDEYLGARDSCYVGWATRDELRAGAASGGVVSALLVYLLERRIIEGALVSRVMVDDGKIHAFPYIARALGDILQGQGSIYMEFPWVRQSYSLLKTSEGPLAVVGLPCNIEWLRRLREKNERLARKVRVLIALACGRSSSKELLLRVLAKKGISEGDVEAIRFREGRWRGQMHVWLKHGSEAEFPFGDFSIYRNLHFFCEKRCLYCEDPLGESADVVCGDVWLPEMMHRDNKPSLVITRTPAATEWIQGMTSDGSFEGSSVPAEKAFRAQRRSLIPAKRGKQAKARLSSAFGYRMRYGGPWQSRWNDYASAAMILANYRWSATRRLAPLILHVPGPVLRLGLVALSLCKNF